MNRQPEVTITLLDLFNSIGFFEKSLVVLAILILILVPNLYLCLKGKRPFLLWVLQQNIKLNLIVTPFLFLKGACWIAIFYQHDGAELIPFHFQETVVGPMFLLGFTILQFVLKFILEAPGKFKEPN